MIKHIKSDLNFKYSLFEISFINDKQKEMILSAEEISEKIKHFLSIQNVSKDITWFYNVYNLFTASCGDENYYNLFVSINTAIKEYVNIHNIKIDNMLYMQSWLNNHSYDEVLKSHNHQCPIHGYISIDPKKSKTVFTHGLDDSIIYEIENFPGLLYIGPGKRFHKVENLDKWEGQRVTIAFDLNDEKTKNLSFIPIIIKD
jgi:hypothetical protein